MPRSEGSSILIRCAYGGSGSTHQEAVVYMRADCHICRAEGFRAHARVGISHQGRSIVATLHHVIGDLLRRNEAGLSESAWQALDAREGDEVAIEHPPTLESLSFVRAKTFGQSLDDAAFQAIIRSCGLTMPKTSSRAITSPAGTADTMETLAPVDLDLAAIRRVVEREGGCIAWGGAVRLSPADDILIRAERALDLDGEGQLVASVLSKKVAAGSTHTVIDVPVGPTAKARTPEAAALLRERLTDVAQAF